MRSRTRFTALFALLAPLVAASVAHAQVVPTQPEIVDWNYNGLAVAAGSGCSGPGDTAFILPAENQLTVIFTGMHVGLTAGQGSNSAIRSCSIVVPAKIKQPDPTSFYYVAQLQETLQYGYVRTSLTNGKIAMASRFFNQPALSKNVNRGSVVNIHECPYAEHRWKFLKNVQHLFYNFGGVAFAPVCRRQDVSELDFSIFMNDPKTSDELVVVS